MFAKILIANRGEIACRIIRTARRLGISSVAVFSDADAQAMHVDFADEAHRIGAAPARESYLLAKRILQAALESGADAIHPGYGFLSENAEFADVCRKCSITFIGPTPENIQQMGDKLTAREAMKDAGLPMLEAIEVDASEPEKYVEKI